MINRLNQFIEYLGVAVRDFEIKINASDGTIRRAIKNKTDIQAKWLIAITENYPNLSAEWLLRNQGEMIKKEATDEQQDKNNLIKDLFKDYGDLREEIGQLKSANKQLQAENKRLKVENEALKTVHLNTDKNTDGEPPAAAV